MLIKQEQIRQAKEKAAIIKSLIDNNKSLMTRTTLAELKKEITKYTIMSQIDEPVGIGEKSNPKSTNRNEYEGLNASGFARADSSLINQSIIHKKKIEIMLVNAEKLTKTLVEEEEQNRTLQDKLDM